ncbi:MAG: hypothetical protein ACRD2X_16755 [Vicinamibacteraceae bacterium]
MVNNLIVTRTASRAFIRTLPLALALAAAGPVQSQTPAGASPYATMAPLEQYLMADRQEEIALARSAAPPSIAGEATIMVLGRRGYETAVTGENGFVCLVDRKWQAPFSEEDFWNPKVRAPICFNPQAVRSVMPINLKRTELVLATKSKQEVKASIKKAFDSKQLGAPEPGAMAYMMSKDQYLDDADPRYKPHLMYYAPSSVKRADWGSGLRGSPVLGGSADAGEPVITFFVPVTHWSDGTPAAVHKQP